MRYDRRDFFRMLGLSGAALAAASVPTLAPRGAEAAAPKGARVILRNGYILSMDPAVGDLRGDILIDNGYIAAIGKNLTAAGAEVVDGTQHIVMPGFIDSHRHTWQSAIRQFALEWPFPLYLRDIFGKFGTNMRPEDVYAGNLLGRLAALEGGITTLCDWSHIMNTSAHADAAIQALRDAGARSVFAMGWPQTPEPAKWIQRSTLDLPDDIRRVRKQHFSSNSGLVTLQMAARGPNFAVMEQLAKDLKTARELGLISTMHTGGGGPVAAQGKAGYLGSDVVLVHLQNATEEEIDMIASTGTMTSISPLGEEWHTGWQGKSAATVRLYRKGIKPSLSADTEAFGGGDMFSIMRGTLSSARHDAGNPGPDVPPPANPQQFDSAKVIPARAIVEMATSYGAKPMGLDGKVGTIKVGKLADIQMLRMNHLNYFPVNDPLNAVIMAADTASVDHVFVEGRPLKFAGRLTNTAMVARARRLAQESRDWLVAKGGVPLPDGLQMPKPAPKAKA